MSKHITIIVNPAAGKEDSILWEINNALQKKDITWNIQVTQKKGDGYTFAKEALKENTSIVAAYGGDGTISEVASALINTKTPLFIIPGGTANVFAKELCLPIDITESLALLAKPKHQKKTIDVGKIDKDFFVLRIEAGFSALTIKTTQRSTKRLFGQFAYFFYGFSKLQKQRTLSFRMKLDDKEILESGVALAIANVGNIGVQGYSVLPQVSLDDGVLDVILAKKISPQSALAWVVSHITKRKPKGEILSWKAKKIVLEFPSEQTMICDDVPIRRKKITVEVLPKALDVIVP